jgi:hypothetical protein
MLRLITITLVALTGVYFTHMVETQDFASLLSDAHAQTPPPTGFAAPVELRAYPALEGYYKYGEWLPIWVEIDNNGGDTRGEIRVPISCSGGRDAKFCVFTAPVELPAGARKRTMLYVLPNNFSRQLQVELVSGTETLAAQKISVNPQPNIAYLTGIIAPERGALSTLQTIEIPGAKRPHEVIDLKLADLPEKYEGLRSLDLIVLNDTDTSSITPAQAAALESWVRRGGRLVVGGGANAQNTLSGLPASLVPVAFQEIREVQQLPGLESWVSVGTNGTRPAISEATPIRVPGPFVAGIVAAASSSASTGNQLASQDDLPLIWEWAQDQGRVNFVALDLSAAPFDAWNGTRDFWEKLVARTAIYPASAPPDVSARQQFASSMPYPLSNLPMLDLPSARGLALLLGIYILLVGPVNYLVLRKQNKYHLAWLTIPAITLVFSAAAFGIGYALHGSDIFVNKIAIIQLEPSGTAQVDSFIGLFSPAQSAYEIQVDGGGLLSPLTPYYDPWNTSAAPSSFAPGRSVFLQQGEPAFMRGLSVEQWSMQSFMSEGIRQDFGPIHAELRLENDHLVGEVRNDTNYTLQDAAIILGGHFVRLGDFPSGKTLPVDLSIDAGHAPNSGPMLSYALFQEQMSASGPSPESRQAEVKRAIVENLFERTPPYVSARSSKSAMPTSAALAPVLIGWLDEAPPRVRIAGSEPAQQTTAIVVAPLSYTFPKSGMITLPAGLIEGELIENPVEGGSCGPSSTTAVYIGRGNAVFEFSLPPEAQNIQLDNLKLGIDTDSGFFVEPEIELYNWGEDDWLPLLGISQGMNLVPGAGQLVSPEGKIKVRLTAQNSQGCYYLTLGLEGRQP